MSYRGFGKVCKFSICPSHEHFEPNREKVPNNRRMSKHNIAMAHKESFDEEALYGTERTINIKELI